MVEIKEGRYGDVKLDGISAVLTLRVVEWVKYYVSKDATDEQAKAVEKLIQAAFQFPADWKVLSNEKVPVTVERTATDVKFSVPASTVEIEMMKGRDGKPIKIQNLPSAYTNDHTQYKSIINVHKSKGSEFSYSGTNAFTSKVIAMSEK